MPGVPVNFNPMLNLELRAQGDIKYGPAGLFLIQDLSAGATVLSFVVHATTSVHSYSDSSTLRCVIVFGKAFTAPGSSSSFVQCVPFLTCIECVKTAHAHTHTTRARACARVRNKKHLLRTIRLLVVAGSRQQVAVVAVGNIL